MSSLVLIMCHLLCQANLVSASPRNQIIPESDKSRVSEKDDNSVGFSLGIVCLYTVERQ